MTPADRGLVSRAPCPFHRPTEAGRRPTGPVASQAIRRGRRSRLDRAGVLAVAVLLLTTAIAACGRDRRGPTLAEAEGALSRCAVPDDSILFLLVVDRSGSMRRDWETVRRQLADLVPALAPDSWLRVEVFDGVVLFPPPVDLQLSHDTIRWRVQRQLASLPPPTPSAYTDLGRAMARVADVLDLRRLPATFVFWISDGQHDPDPHGRSPYVHERAPAFDTLRQRFERILAEPGRVVRSTVIPIGPEAIRGGALIRSVVPGTEVLDGPIAGQRIAAELGARIRDARRQALAGRVRPEVAEPRLRIELANGIQTTRALWRTAELQALIRSHARCVTYRIASVPDSPLVLPNSAAAITVPVDPPWQWPRLLPWSPARRDTFPPRDGHAWRHPVAVRFEPAAKLGPAGVLADDKLRTAGTYGVEVAGIVEYRPIAWGWFVVLVLLLAIVLGCTYLWIAPPARIRFLPIRNTPPEPDASGAPHEYVIDTGRGRIKVAVRRRRRLSWPKHVTLTIAAEDRTNAAVATPRDDGNYDLHRIASRSEAAPGCYIVWRDDPAAAWPPTVTEIRLRTDYIGYEIEA